MQKVPLPVEYFKLEIGSKCILMRDILQSTIHKMIIIYCNFDIFIFVQNQTTSSIEKLAFFLSAIYTWTGNRISYDSEAKLVHPSVIIVGTHNGTVKDDEESANLVCILPCVLGVIWGGSFNAEFILEPKVGFHCIFTWQGFDLIKNLHIGKQSLIMMSA